MSSSSVEPAAVQGESAPRAAEVLSPYGYIAIEGLIGAGKTTLSRRLAERFAGRTVLEEQGNPGNLFSVRGFIRLFVPIP